MDGSGTDVINLAFRGDRISKKTDAFNLDFADIANLHEHFWIASPTNAGRRSRDNDVARLKGEAFAEIRDERRNVEDRPDAPSGNSSAVTIGGPNAPVPSKFLPSVHCVVSN